MKVIEILLDLFFFYDKFILMKKIFIILASLVILPSLLIAQTREENRRIEEEKRENLRPSEGRIPKEKKATSPPLDPIDIIYFVELMPRKIAFRYDACKALVILKGVENQFIDLGSQIAFLRKNSILPKRFESEFDPTKPLRKGLTAYMFCKALEIKGGIFLRLLGMSERYALKELVHQGMMSSGNVKDIVGGEELVSILTQAGNYMAKRRETKDSEAKGVR